MHLKEGEETRGCRAPRPEYEDRRASLGRRAASSLPAPRRDALLSAALRCSAAEEEEQNRVGDRFYNAPQKSIIDLGSAYIRFL